MDFLSLPISGKPLGGRIGESELGFQDPDTTEMPSKHPARQVGLNVLRGLNFH